jgi:HSP20 family protein
MEGVDSMALLKREARTAVPEPVDRFGAIDRTFDRMFDLWPMMRPFRLPTLMVCRWIPDEFIRVDEYDEDGVLVVKAELPGIDPDKDVDVTVTDGMLRIEAERRQEEHKEGTVYVGREMNYGSFTRTLPLPEGVSESDIKPSYEGGILEIRVPAPEPVSGTKVPISKT